MPKMLLNSDISLYSLSKKDILYSLDLIDNKLISDTLADNLFDSLYKIHKERIDILITDIKKKFVSINSIPDCINLDTTNILVINYVPKKTIIDEIRINEIHLYSNLIYIEPVIVLYKSDMLNTDIKLFGDSRVIFYHKDYMIKTITDVLILASEGLTTTLRYLEDFIGNKYNKLLLSDGYYRSFDHLSKFILNYNMSEYYSDTITDKTCLNISYNRDRLYDIYFMIENSILNK